MKTKFLAGLVASLICLIVIVVAAILMTAYLSPDASDRMIKMVAFGAIAIWLGLYSWLKPKAQIETQTNKTSENQLSSKKSASHDTSTDRNSYS